jgi:peptidoglycan/LPS O-acetylase OafA/YrhL
MALPRPAMVVRAQTGVPTGDAPARSAERVAPLPALTGLRFVAAALIVAHHWMRHWRVGVVPTGALHAVLWMGYQAVSFFFVLSGFILAYGYIQRNGELRTSSRRFYVARFARIYPSYIVAFLLAAAPFLLATPAPTRVGTLATALSTLTLTQAWAADYVGGWNGPGWSLSAEMFFYLLFPLVAVPIGRLSQRQLHGLLCVLWATSLCFPLGYLVWVRLGLTPYYYFPSIVYTTPLARLPEFLMGMALGRLFIVHRTRYHAPPRIAMLALLAFLGAGLVLLLVNAIPGPLPLTGLLAPAWGALIYSCAWGRGTLPQWLGRRVMITLGEASYAIYMLHWPLWWWFTRLLGVPDEQNATLTMPSGLLFAAYCLMLVALSLIVFARVETPARRVIRERFVS